MKRFEPVEHTADIGIKVYGKSLAELFTNAAAGMFDAIAQLKFFQPKTNFKLDLEAANKEELLVSWLRELLYKYISEEFILVKFEILEISENKIRAVVSGEKIKDKSKIKKDIKAVTYHDLHIDKKDNHYETQIIFDV